MPLIHSKRPAAFKHNIEVEMKAGKPQKQAVAIAYSEAGEKRKKYSEGGEVGPDCPDCESGTCEEHMKDQESEEKSESNLNSLPGKFYGMRQPRHMKRKE